MLKERRNAWIVLAELDALTLPDRELLHQRLARIMALCNLRLRNMLAELTLVDDDQLQAVAGSLSEALSLVDYLDQLGFAGSVPLQFHCVIHWGEVTAQAPEKGTHGLLGRGLKEARALLSDRKRKQPRVRISGADASQLRNIERLWHVADSIRAKWKPCDFELIHTMLQISSDRRAAQAIGTKNPSQIWKRRKNLRVNEYADIKAVIFDLAA